MNGSRSNWLVGGFCGLIFSDNFRSLFELWTNGHEDESRNRRAKAEDKIADIWGEHLLGIIAEAYTADLQRYLHGMHEQIHRSINPFEASDE